MEINIDPMTRKDLSDDEYKYLKLLEFHRGFIKEVQKIRQRLGIPVSEDGQNVTSFEPPDGRKLRKLVSRLVLRLNIPYTLRGSVESIVKWNHVQMATKPVLVLNPEFQLNRSLLFNKNVWPRGKASIKDAKSQELIDESWYRHNQSLAKSKGTNPFIPVILILKPLTKKELIGAIERAWKDQIAPAIEDYKKSVPYPVEITKVPIREVEIYVKMLRLRLEGKTHQEVAHILHIEHDSVREKYSKISKILRQIGFPSLEM